MLAAMRGLVASVVVVLACSHAPSGPPPTAADAPFGCASCDPSSQFCYETASGVLPLQPQCMALPPACTSTPTCACVLANIDQVCPGLMGHPTCAAGQPMSVTCAVGI